VFFPSWEGLGVGFPVRPLSVWEEPEVDSCSFDRMNKIHRMIGQKMYLFFANNMMS
jgi:hypothetical protein